MASTSSSPKGFVPRILAHSTADLIEQVAWFNRLRLGAVLGMLVLIAVAAHALRIVADPVPLYALAALTLAVDVVYLRWFPRLAGRPARYVRRHVDLQIAIDVGILTAILHWAGGVTNPFVLFYLFHAFIAALLLSVRAALVVVVVATAMVASLAFVERYGLLQHHPITVALFDVRHAQPAALVAWISVFAATLLLSVYFVGTVLWRLIKREEQLAHLDRQLAHSEKLASIGNLAAGVAHEINNPVGVILSKVQILRYRIGDGDGPDVLMEELGTVEKHARRIATITDGLLTFSRETPFDPVPIDLNDLVREGVELVKVPFQTAGVALRTRLTQPGPRVLGSTNHLLQVLVNVMLNAKDASAGRGPVTVGTAVAGGEAAIRIEDLGEGIAADNLSKIFDPFFTTKDVDSGTGLGLAISHGIIEKHQGRIEVQSDEGVGTTFTVWLPVASELARRDS